MSGRDSTVRPGELDKRFCWHPFTQMSEWCAPGHDPIVLVAGRGAMLTDDRGREYLDGNSSIWTNIHGHNHPKLNAAIEAQLRKVAHTSFLGFANEPAALLAERLVGAYPSGGRLTRVFFSDDGSTAIEVALKMTVQFWQQSGQPERRRFVAFSAAYHGDTMGAASLGGVGVFSDRFAGYHFPVERVGSAEALDLVGTPAGVAAVVIEPLIQGVNGMRPWPAGMLRDVRAWCDRHDVLLIADEIMTGFGRTGTLFACEQEGVAPDFVALAKGLTGGYMPLAATLVSGRVFDAFLGGPEEHKAFYYGHSYTANPLGCAVALASLEIFDGEGTLALLQPKIRRLSQLLDGLRDVPHIGDVRQCGFIAGIDVVADSASRRAYPPAERVGARVCIAARGHGLLTRPILDTIVLMPPLCASEAQVAGAVDAIRQAVADVCGR